MSKTKLKNCPFCGGKPTTYNAIDQMWGLSVWYVLCDCGCRLGDCETEEEIIEAWNHRAEKTAKWVYAKYDYEKHKYIPDENLKKGTLVCSACLNEAYRDSDGYDVEFPYCPNCGAAIIVDV